MFLDTFCFKYVGFIQVPKPHSCGWVITLARWIKQWRTSPLPWVRFSLPLNLCHFPFSRMISLPKKQKVNKKLCIILSTIFDEQNIHYIFRNHCFRFSNLEMKMGNAVFIFHWWFALNDFFSPYVRVSHKSWFFCIKVLFIYKKKYRFFCHTIHEKKNCEF